MHDDHNPFESSQYSTSAPSHSQQPPSGPIIGVAVASFVLGGLSLLCGGCLAVAGGSLFGLLQTAMQNNPEFQDPDGQKVALIGGGVIIGLGILYILFGGVQVAAGFGALKLKPWGRILVIVMAILQGLLGGLLFLSSIFQLNPFGCLFAFLQFGYCIFALVVMFSPVHTAEFQNR